MSEYDDDFAYPEVRTIFLKTKDFEGEGRKVTYKGAKKQYSEAEGGKYNINYTDNELIMKDGKPWLDKQGNTAKNPLYDENFPNGYQVVLGFEEGDFTCGSKPCYEAIARIRPCKGDVLHIRKEGEKTETTWHVKLLSTLSDDSPF